MQHWITYVHDKLKSLPNLSYLGKDDTGGVKRKGGSLLGGGGGGLRGLTCLDQLQKTYLVLLKR
jgi:hypothetical protein